MTGWGRHAEITAAVKNHHDMMEHWEALLPGQILAVPYEALVADQEGWTRRMLQHCKLPWDDAVLQFHNTQRDVHTASVSQARPSAAHHSPLHHHGNLMTRQSQPAAKLAMGSHLHTPLHLLLYRVSLMIKNLSPTDKQGLHVATSAFCLRPNLVVT